MPMGYLKHNQDEVGKKIARGGSSHKNVSSCKKSSNHVGYDLSEDFILPAPLKKEGRCNGAGVKPTERLVSPPMAECTICFEIRPIIMMSNACTWHGGACFECSRRIYVMDAQKDQSNYPLQCYHPQCQVGIKWGQLYKHGLIQSKAEKDKYHEMMNKNKLEQLRIIAQKQFEKTRAKFAEQVKSRDNLVSVSCPHCDKPKLLKRKDIASDKVFQCQHCKHSYLVSPDYATIAAIERCQGKDRVGDFSSGWAKCPSCGVIISKGYGCDHMSCFCGHSFSWTQSQQRAPHAIVPADQLHLWW